MPALLAQTYYQLCNITGVDPREWSILLWFILLGPLWGVGFLAGATIGLPDDAANRGVRGWLARAAAWVGIGPWLGFLSAVAVYYLWEGTAWLVARLGGPSRLLSPMAGDTWYARVLVWCLIVGVPYGWLIVAFAALRRARRIGRLWAALRRGVVTAVAFVGSLIGSFFAVTEAWRSYFFDNTMPRLVILAILSATFLSGCGTPTVGELRRRELFASMLTAWVLGLALAWRWWARSRPRPPGR